VNIDVLDKTKRRLGRGHFAIVRLVLDLYVALLEQLAAIAVCDTVILVVLEGAARFDLPIGVKIFLQDDRVAFSRLPGFGLYRGLSVRGRMAEVRDAC